jgi:hypothetical protein
MKKISLLIFTLLILFRLQNLSAQGNSDFYLNLGEKTVTTGSIVNLRVVYGAMGDTSNHRIFDNVWVKNWLVNGQPNDPNLYPGGTYATYQVPDQMPEKNPISISCDLINKDPALGKITLVSNILVEDFTNQIVIDGATYIIEAGHDTSINKYSNSNVRAISGNGTTVCTMVGNNVSFTFSIAGTAPGTYTWSQQTAMGGSVGLQAYGSLDPNTKKSAEGETVITEYGDLGKLIKGTFHGILWTAVGMKSYSVPVSGKFAVVRTKY